METTKWILILGLVGVAGYAIWKHQSSAAAQQAALHAKGTNTVSGNNEPAGVPLFSSILAPNRIDQLAAWQTSTPDSTVDGTYAPAFGANENQPDSAMSML